MPSLFKVALNWIVEPFILGRGIADGEVKGPTYAPPSIEISRLTDVPAGVLAVHVI